MKKIIIMCLIGMLFLSACSSVKQTFEKIPEDYGLSQAKADGCVVHENGSITSGQEAWNAFVEKCESGQKASVRLGYYYTLDRKGVSEELYEKEKDDYPVLYIHDLSYNGKEYTLLEKNDEGNTIVSKYKYMKRYEGSPNSKSATYSYYVNYVLVNKEDVTWEQIEHCMFSATLKFENYIGGYRRVYTMYTYKEETDDFLLHETPKMYDLTDSDSFHLMPSVALYENGYAMLSQPVISSFAFSGSGRYKIEDDMLIVFYGEEIVAKFKISDDSSTLKLESISGLAFAKVGSVYKYNADYEIPKRFDNYNENP